MRTPRLVGIVAVTILAGAVLYFGTSVMLPNMPAETSTSTSSASPSGATTREGNSAVSARAACEAGCRNQYGGSGSAGFDACIRACGAGGVLREECPPERPACPSGESPLCRRGVWYCRDASSRVFPETNNFNFPTDAQMREGACGEPGLACESPTIPECRNGTWICIGPATGVR